MTVEKEAHSPEVFALPVAESVHQLLQLCSSLDFEKDFIVVVGDFDVQVFGGGWRLVAVRRLFLVGHGVEGV